VVEPAEFIVPFLDLKEHQRRIWPDLERAVGAVLREAQFILGAAVERFETAFARYLGTKFCVGLNSGTSALHLALQACDIGPGDEVITTPHTWISTCWAIRYVGARPVFVDIDPVSCCMAPDLVQQAITPRTKALLPVHLYGRACDMEALCGIARQHDLLLIEDAAQAHGAVHGRRRVGSFGNAGCFSFYPAKNLGAFGEAGAVVTDDEQLAQRIRRLRDHAQDGRHNHVELGHNARMEGIQGAVLEVKLPHLDAWNAARGRHADRYRQLLSALPGIRLPAPAAAGEHVWHLYVVQLDGIDRDRLQGQLRQRRIASAVHYPTPVHLQPACADLGYALGDFPVAEDVTGRCLSLPMFAEMTDEQIVHTSAALGECVGAGS